MADTGPGRAPSSGTDRAHRRADDEEVTGLTTDDHTCVLLLDDVVLRQVLATRDTDDRAMLVRLNLAANGVGSYTGRLIGHRAEAHVAAAADRARHPSAGRHAAVEQPTDPSVHRAAA